MPLRSLQSLLTLLAVFAAVVLTQAQSQADLAISIARSSPSPAQYSIYSVTVTLTNDGPDFASNIIVDIPRPAGVVYEGGNEFTASVGSFSTFGATDGEWLVPTIAPRGIATLTVNYFLLSPDVPVSYAQVIASSKADPDSTPGNGTPPNATEDDEASTLINGGFVPDLTLTNLALTQNPVDSGQQVDFTFDINNVGAGSIGQNFLIQSYFSTDATLSPDDLQNGSVPTGNFAPGQTVSGVNGAAVPVGLAPGSYFLILVADANDQVLESDETNNTVAVPLTLRAPGGTGGGGDIDLSLTLSQNPGQPTQFSLYSVTATVSNAGAQLATGVVVDVPLPQGVVYEGGNEFQASQGSFATFGGNQGEWTVGNLAAGASATLTINYFVLAQAAPNSYAEVAAANEIDGDSTPGNGNGQVNEDDEASTGNGPSGPVCDLVITIDSTSCVRDGGAPGPFDDDFLVYGRVTSPSRTSQDTVYVFVAGLANAQPVAYGEQFAVNVLLNFNRGTSFTLDAFASISPNTCQVSATQPVPAPCLGPPVVGPCTFEQPLTLDPQDFGPYVLASTSSTGFELVSQRAIATTTPVIAVATYTFAPDGTQLSATPVVAPVDRSTSVFVDYPNLELQVTPQGGTTSTVPFADPFPTGAPYSADDGFALRLPDNSGYLIGAVRSDFSGSSDSSLVRYFEVDNNFQPVGPVYALPGSDRRLLGPLSLLESGQGNYFLRFLAGGAFVDALLIDGDDYAPLSTAPVRLGFSGRLYMPIVLTELADGSFVEIAAFDGRDPTLRNRITRYDRQGNQVSQYFSSQNFEGRNVSVGAVRPDGGFVGVSLVGQSGNTVEVQDGTGALLAETYLDGYFRVNPLGVADDNSILASARRDSLNGALVFLKLTPLGALECNPTYDPCDPPVAQTNPIVSFSSAPGGIITIEHVLYGRPGTITIDGPARLGVTLIDPTTFVVNDVKASRTDVIITGTFRDATNPANSQPFFIRTDRDARPLLAIVPQLGASDISTYRIAGFNTPIREVVTAYESFNRTFGLALVGFSNVVATGGQVGDLVTNRIGGVDVDQAAGLVYLGYRNANSSSWPRLRILNLTDLSLRREVLLGELVFSGNDPITGLAGQPKGLGDGTVAIGFFASERSTTGDYAAVLDTTGTPLSVTTLPSPVVSSRFAAYDVAGCTPAGDLLFTVQTSSGSTESVALLADGSLQSCGGGSGGQGVDLELSATSGQPQPPIYDQNAVTITLTNAGTAPATGIIVDVPKPTGVVYTGGNEFTASQGSLSTFGADQGEWTVGSLAPGATATLVVRYFSLSATGYTQFAEVLSQNEPDIDSTPGNGSGVSADEDDEIYLDLSFGSRAALNLDFYPNPAPQGEQIVLRYTSSGDTDTRLVISDLNGRVVQDLNVNFAEGPNAVPVTIGHLQAGVYLVAMPGTGLQPTRLVVR